MGHLAGLIEIETQDKDQTNCEDVPSRTVSDLTSLGHILTPPGQVKKAISARFFSRITFVLRKIADF